MRIKVLLIIMISVCILSACSFVNVKESENEASVETEKKLGLVPPGESFVGNVIEIVNDTQVCVQITWRSKSKYEIGEYVYVNYKKVDSICYATSDDDAEWDKVGKCQDIIEEDEALIEYFSKISIGDEIIFAYRNENDIIVEDGKVCIKEGTIIKKVFDPHLDPVFEGKYDF